MAAGTFYQFPCLECHLILQRLISILFWICLEMLPTNVTLGRTILESRGLNYDDYMYWVCLSALFGLALIYNTIFTLALSFLKCKFQHIRANKCHIDNTKELLLTQ